MTVFHDRNKQKYILGSFWGLKRDNDKAKPAAEAAAIETEKFIRNFLSGKPIQTENSEIKLVKMIVN
jgi:hypothetical protein